MTKELEFDRAREIIARMIAIACENGFNPDDPDTAQLLYEQEQINLYNEQYIKKALEIYSQIVRF